MATGPEPWSEGNGDGDGDGLSKWASQAQAHRRRKEPMPGTMSRCIWEVPVHAASSVDPALVAHAHRHCGYRSPTLKTRGHRRA